ncbi:MAG: thiamine diphosphokinase [Chloroflexota bacterium]|nr:thiamine diphosphokinase [Chloroflexota bacterium]
MSKDTASKRAFVVASSPRAEKPPGLDPQPGEVVIAADGGANRCIEWDWPITRIVGDMDSIDREVLKKLNAAGVPMEAYSPEKDQTDLEIALGRALDADPDEIIIAGVLGARIDHTLGNLGLLALPELIGTPTRIVDGRQTIWLVRGESVVNGEVGDTLSLIPYGGEAGGVSLTGVHWPLQQAELPLGPSLSISNRLVESSAVVSVTEGMVLVVHVSSTG